MNITEAACVKSKSYAIQLEANEYNQTPNRCEKKLKGIPKRMRDKHITFQDYKDCIFGAKGKSVSFNHIMTKNFKVKTFRSNKIALSPINIKFFYLCDIHAVPYFSKISKTWNSKQKCPFCCNSDSIK